MSSDEVAAHLAWIQTLSLADVQLFLAELIAAAQAEPAPAHEWADELRQTVHEWRESAAIYADPELLAALTRPVVGDFRPVPDPRLPKDRP